MKTPTCKCSARVYVSGQFRPSPCSRAGTVKEDGKMWCKQHAPSVAQARMDKSIAASRARYQIVVRQASCVKACTGMKDPEVEIKNLRECRHVLERINGWPLGFVADTSDAGPREWLQEVLTLVRATLNRMKGNP